MMKWIWEIELTSRRMINSTISLHNRKIITFFILICRASSICPIIKLEKRKFQWCHQVYCRTFEQDKRANFISAFHLSVQCKLEQSSNNTRTNFQSHLQINLRCHFRNFIRLTSVTPLFHPHMHSNTRTNFPFASTETEICSQAV